VGLDNASVMFLCAAKSMGVDFANTIMIGRQNFFPDAKTLQGIFSVLGVTRDAGQFLRENEGGEGFFSLLGASQVSSVDVSDYEGATHIHDMNRPLPADLAGRFSVVHDGGTLEHVFNFPQALKNCMEMVVVGGHFVQVGIANNFMGHGFWQISPELIYRVFSPANGFEIEAVLLHEVIPGGRWYLTPDPQEVGGRVELCNSRPTYILTLARKVAHADIFASIPQQSDYVSAWNMSAGRALPVWRRHGGLRTRVPRPVKRLLKGVFILPKMGFRRKYYRRIDEAALLRGELRSSARG
jgi:hypothetical protein